MSWPFITDVELDALATVVGAAAAGAAAATAVGNTAGLGATAGDCAPIDTLNVPAVTDAGAGIGACFAATTGPAPAFGTFGAGTGAGGMLGTAGIFGTGAADPPPGCEPLGEFGDMGAVDATVEARPSGTEFGAELAGAEATGAVELGATSDETGGAESVTGIVVFGGEEGGGASPARTSAPPAQSKTDTANTTAVARRATLIEIVPTSTAETQ